MRTRSTLLLVAAVMASCAAPPQDPVDLLIESATLVDVGTGDLLTGRSIAIAKGAIVGISDAAPRFNATRVVNAQGKFVMPGLWDMHVHFGGGAGLIEENKNLLPLYLAHGVTTVRDAAGDLSPSVLAWRSAIASGTLLGPTIYTSGPKLEGYNSVWPGDSEVGSAAEIATALAANRAMGVDFIKITDSALSPELYRIALQTATSRDFRTSAHVPLALTLDEVSAAGLTTVEHMSYLLRGGSPREGELSAAVAAGTLTPADAMEQFVATFDPVVAVETYRKLAARGTAVVPTLNGSRILAYLDNGDHAQDDYLKYLGPGLKATYAGRVERAARDDAAAVEERHRRHEMSAALVPLVRQAGMRIIAGTDAGFLNSFNYPGIGLHDELEVLVNAGLTPLQALQASIVNGPAFFGKADPSGRVSTGQVADLIILNRNPLADIRATRDIDAVVVKGRHLDRTALDAMLADVAARAARKD